MNVSMKVPLFWMWVDIRESDYLFSIPECKKNDINEDGCSIR